MATREETVKQGIKDKIEQALTEYDMACFAPADRHGDEIPGQTIAVIDAIWPEIEKLVHTQIPKKAIGFIMEQEDGTKTLCYL